jgi:hypothetical protein
MATSESRTRIFAKLTILLCFALLAGANFASAADAPRPPAGLTMPAQLKQMPAFNLPGVNGAAVRAEDMRGQVLIVRFWATW